MAEARILTVRLGAMGDIIHALPAVATLKHSFPHCRLTWAVEAKWAELLAGNPFVDEVLCVERRSVRGLGQTARLLWGRRFDVAVDFQGLLKSAVVATLTRPERIFGFHASQVRERAAAWFYSRPTKVEARHVVDRNLELAHAAGASNVVHNFPLPPGRPEGELPVGPFVLASPLAGWAGKQWPLEHYAALAAGLREHYGVPLVLNGPPAALDALRSVPGVLIHVSGLAGLIHATRRALAVVGVDSGPLHLAAALGKPGVAVFGPTDPARNGPYGGTFTVLRDPAAGTTYRRESEETGSMRAVEPRAVLDALSIRAPELAA